MFLAFRHLRCFFLLCMSGSPLWLLTSSNRAWSQTKFFVVKTAVAYTYFTVKSRRTSSRSSINLKLSWISRWTVGWCFYRLGSNGHWLGIVRQEKHSYPRANKSRGTEEIKLCHKTKCQDPIPSKRIGKTIKQGPAFAGCIQSLNVIYLQPLTAIQSSTWVYCVSGLQQSYRKTGFFSPRPCLIYCLNRI